MIEELKEACRAAEDLTSHTEDQLFIKTATGSMVWLLTRK
jgi:hypothetical protein